MAIIAAASRAAYLMCSLEVLIPRQTHSGSLSMKKHINSVVPQQIHPQLGSALLIWVTHRISCECITPTWGISIIFLKTTPRCRKTTHRYPFSRHWGRLLWNPATWHSWSWRATENYTQGHQIPGMNHNRAWGYSRRVIALPVLHKNTAMTFLPGLEAPPPMSKTSRDQRLSFHSAKVRNAVIQQGLNGK